MTITRELSKLRIAKATSFKMLLAYLVDDLLSLTKFLPFLDELPKRLELAMQILGYTLIISMIVLFIIERKQKKIVKDIMKQAESIEPNTKYEIKIQSQDEFNDYTIDKAVDEIRNNKKYRAINEKIETDRELIQDTMLKLNEYIKGFENKKFLGAMRITTKRHIIKVTKQLDKIEKELSTLEIRAVWTVYTKVYNYDTTEVC
jgi:hypothetical protein